MQIKIRLNHFKEKLFASIIDDNGKEGKEHLILCSTRKIIKVIPRIAYSDKHNICFNITFDDNQAMRIDAIIKDNAIEITGGWTEQ